MDRSDLNDENKFSNVISQLWRALQSRRYRSILNPGAKSENLVFLVEKYSSSNTIFTTKSGRKLLMSIITLDHFKILSDLLKIEIFESKLIENPHIIYKMLLKAVKKNSSKTFLLLKNNESIFNAFLDYLRDNPSEVSINMFDSLWGHVGINKCYIDLSSNKTIVSLLPLDYIINFSNVLINKVNKPVALNFVKYIATEAKHDYEIAHRPLFETPYGLTERENLKVKRRQKSFKRLLVHLYILHPVLFEELKDKINFLCDNKVDRLFDSYFEDFNPERNEIYSLDKVPIFSPKLHREVFEDDFHKSQNYSSLMTFRFFSKLILQSKYAGLLSDSQDKATVILQSMPNNVVNNILNNAFKQSGFLSDLAASANIGLLFNDYRVKAQYLSCFLNNTVGPNYIGSLDRASKDFIYSMLDENLDPPNFESKRSLKKYFFKSKKLFKKILDDKRESVEAISWLTHPDFEYFQEVSLSSIRKLWSESELYPFSRNDTAMILWFYSSFANTLLKSDFLDYEEFERLSEDLRTLSACRIEVCEKARKIVALTSEHLESLVYSINWLIHSNVYLGRFIYSTMMENICEMSVHTDSAIKNHVDEIGFIKNTDSKQVRSDYLTFISPMLHHLVDNIRWPFFLNTLKRELNTLDSLSQKYLALHSKDDISSPKELAIEALSPTLLFSKPKESSKTVELHETSEVRTTTDEAYATKSSVFCHKSYSELDEEERASTSFEFKC